MAQRYAIYYCLDKADPVHDLASRWLEYELYSGEALTMDPDASEAAWELAGMESLHGRASVYGFHATLKAPFFLAGDKQVTQLEAELEAFASSTKAFDCAPLALNAIGDFIALMPSSPCVALQQLAADCVTRFDDFRKPPEAGEIARRHPEHLSENQHQMLEQWGYPYVLDEFRFHMTLSDAVPANKRELLTQLLAAYLKPVLGGPLNIDRLCLCSQGAPGSSFRVRKIFPLKTA